ncbi:four helix bundle protein [Chryseobacterium edaphi]|uniref:four helix bundle protein n=1 Tax=Chryseobacterium edaphi TaxID=2976532 RepID=UPI0026E52052|nr:four helix bundle protein [Chryseobacterium edaphi]
MSTIISFKYLIVWQKSHELVLCIYKVTSQFPKEETYALTSQIRRAAVSVPANIAEGFKKKTLANKLNFLSHSDGSLEEVKYYLILAKDLSYISLEKYLELELCCEEVSKLISGYAKNMKNYYNNKATNTQQKN